MTTSMYAMMVTAAILTLVPAYYVKRVHKKSLLEEPALVPCIFKCSPNVYYVAAFGIIFFISVGIHEGITLQAWFFSAVLTLAFIIFILAGTFVFLKESLEITNDKIIYTTISSKDIIELSNITNIKLEPIGAINFQISGRDKPLTVLLIFENAPRIVSTLRTVTKFPI